MLVLIERLTTHVEWSCHESVANILSGARKVVRLTNSIKALRQHNPTKFLSILVQSGSCCYAFDAVYEDTTKLRKEAFIAGFRELAIEAGVYPNDEPRKRTEQLQTPDLTIIKNINVDRSNYCCFLRRNDTLEQTLFLPDYYCREFEAGPGCRVPLCWGPGRRVPVPS